MVPRPRERSGFRSWMGSLFFTWKRYYEWYSRPVRQARQREDFISNPHVVFEHSTPLLRKLRNVDMRLQHNKITNLSLAIRRLDNTVIQPGETLSFWRSVGRPTRRKGYLEGMVLEHGRVVAGTGGGLCQLSNLIYWMTLHTPLTVTERWRHDYDVFPDTSRSQPFGSGATVSYNYVDLQIRNDTAIPYLLRLWLSTTHLHGQWLATALPAFRYEVYQDRHWINQEIWGGYTRHNTIRRRVFDLTGQEIGDQFVTENHAIMMYNPMLPDPAQQA